MWTLTRMIAPALLIVALAGCSPSPKSVAEQFFDHLKEGNVTAAKEIATPQTAGFIDMMVAMNGLPKGDIEFVRQEKISDTEALIVVKNEDGEEQKVTVIKLDGKWKVNLLPK